ncbi:hypothetical protein C2G38_2043925 [Gigaspora rosea]|uniref:Uncharacterized protein n=1 Tax=Gigaspora rosea TaxID=44941 RepID=A0A397UHZ6_9GLOM|nr:hypothetical protein C2G38_2043925 [Gigaspora rosea]
MKNLESIVKISSYLMSNPKQELHYYGLDLTEEEIQTVFQDITLFSEVNDEENYPNNSDNSDNSDNFDNSTDFSDPEIEHQDLELENFIELNNVEQDIDNESMDKSIGVNTDKHTDENTDDDEFNNEEFNEDQLGAELEELIYHSQ